MSVSNRNSGIHAQAHEKCAMKMKESRRKKEKENDGRVKNFLMRQEGDFVCLLLKLDVTDVDELQANNSLHNKGTICLVNG